MPLKISPSFSPTAPSSYIFEQVSYFMICMQLIIVQILQKEQEAEEIDQLIETNRLKNIHFNIILKKLFIKNKRKR